MGKRVLRRALAIVMPLALSCTAALGADNAAAIEEFGIEKGEPIESGFFFWNCEYVEAPYVVERRGLDIYINDHLVSAGPEWPPYDETVNEDPGEPPPGSSPFDPTPPGMDYRDEYWNRKERYVYQHFGERVARRRMIEAFRKCGAFRKVVADKRDDRRVVVTMQSGKTVGVILTPGGNPDPPDRNKWLAAREAQKAYYENPLRGNVLLAVGEGSGERGVGGRRLRRAMEILLSEASHAEKIKALEGILFVPGEDESAHALVTKFKPTRELIERFNRLQGRPGKSKPRKPPADDTETPRLEPPQQSPQGEKTSARDEVERALRMVQRTMERERWKRQASGGSEQNKAPGRASAGDQSRHPGPPSTSGGDSSSGFSWLALAVISLWTLVGITAVAIARKGGGS